MTHYSVDQWWDYVCGLAPAEERSSMDRHLEAGCEYCKKVEGMWRATMKLAKKEIDYQPPERALRFVMGQFAQVSQRGKLPTQRRLNSLQE
jgi:anti-sigma factor RsiW